MYCPIYSTKLVRETSIPFRGKLNSTKAACSIVGKLLAEAPNERFVVVLLDTKLQPIGASIVTEGTLDASLVHPREVFRPAILANASAVIIAHNHPSGDCEPSRQDWQVFERVKSCGEMLGITCHDSIIVRFVGGELQTYSMQESRGEL